MHIRRLLLPASLTLCAAALACLCLSGYVPVAPVKNAPAVATRFDGAQAMQRLDSLTHKFKGRVVGSAQDFAAADYIAGEFLSYGLRLETQDFREFGAMDKNTLGWYKGRNVIGILPGREQGTIVFTAHRDCVPQAPEGAYDNGSGTATVLELARVLAGSPHRYTYAFIALDGEEIGLAGARSLLNSRPAALSDIRLMVNLDMVGFKGSPRLGVAHTQYLSPETRALAANRFSLPRYELLQSPMGRGTDAQLYVLRGLPTLDVREIIPMFTKIENHSAGDTYDQVSADSIQQAGRSVEQLILQGDAIGAFTPSRGLAPFNGSGFLPRWRYLLGGAFLFIVFVLPLVFRLRTTVHFSGPMLIMIALILLIGILTALSARWHGSIKFAALPFWGLIIFLALQAIATRWSKYSDGGFVRLLLAAVPPLLFGATWLLTGLWALGLWIAAIAYLPAVMVTWKTGWGWRILDIVLISPTLLLTWCIAFAAWLSAPTHLFPAAKLPFFAAIYAAAALIGIWGIFGSRGCAENPDAEYAEHAD